jgi:hypothetical protein
MLGGGNKDGNRIMQHLRELCATIKIQNAATL